MLQAFWQAASVHDTGFMLPLSLLASDKLSWSFAALLEGGRPLVEGILHL